MTSRRQAISRRTYLAFSGGASRPLQDPGLGAPVNYKHHIFHPPRSRWFALSAHSYEYRGRSPRSMRTCAIASAERTP